MKNGAENTEWRMKAVTVRIAAQKMKFSIKDFFSKCDQIHRKLNGYLMKSLMEDFFFCAVNVLKESILRSNLIGKI